MTSRTITRGRGARGQLVLYNPHTVPIEEATGCLADVMISQRQGEFPPVAFMLVHREVSGFSIERTVDRKARSMHSILKAQQAFKNAFAIAVLPIPQYSRLQLLAMRSSASIKIFPAFSIRAAVKLMVSVHEKHAIEVSKKADLLNQRMDEELLTRQHAMHTLRTNFPFLSVDECDMLLDLFGNIASISLAGAEKLLDMTVLSTSAAHAIETFFTTEYVVE
ncbi:unnamed protein product [Hyaloperonospora brassicae]|uniref:Uncharacterized protein n=1 Tax=Hyaloperonospora brassicae TaxID=162125 RepID=A0AAV0UES4_HYABA|nr:unnamed protein product [Hyaloperonospora brassicae]